MKAEHWYFIAAVFAFGVMTGLIIALIIQANILQADTIYPFALPQVWA